MRAKVAWLLAIVLLVGGCAARPVETPEPQPDAPTPEVIVGTGERLVSMDPAAPTTRLGDLVTLDVFQRLMVVTKNNELRPDAAQDCAFRQIQLYECVLKKGLKFHNGEELKSSDVRFSIERAIKLKAPGVENLVSLRDMDTPDDHTIRFNLAWSDSDFGQFLSMPSLSIVDESVYEKNRLRSVAGLPVGSGPFFLVSANDYALRFSKFADYQGANSAQVDQVRVRLLAGVAAGETALSEASVDVLWQALDSPAVERVRSGMAALGDDGEQIESVFEVRSASSRSVRLEWLPSSPKISQVDVRKALSTALQRKREALSLLPTTDPAYVPAFSGGGTSPKPDAAVELKLTYDSSAVDMADMAWALASQAHRFSNLSIKVRPDDAHADLLLTDSPVPVDVPAAWLRPFVDRSGKKEAQKLEIEARTAIEKKSARVSLRSLQKLAAAEALVLPVRNLDTSIFVKKGVQVDSNATGPGEQFVLWGIRR